MTMNFYSVTFFVISVLLLLCAIITASSKRIFYPIILTMNRKQLVKQYPQLYMAYAKLTAISAIAPIIAGALSMYTTSLVWILIIFGVVSVIVIIAGVKMLFKEFQLISD